MRLCGALAAHLALVIATGASAERAPLTVLYTGETHAMLLPCDCPYRPEGGMARRATAVVRERRKGAAVLVDAGGWAAGGLYDEYTEGREVDALRTGIAARAMAAVGYDAVALSDEELACGLGAVRSWLEEHGLPLVSANLFDAKTGGRVAPPLRMIERGGWKIAVVGLTPAEIDILAPETAATYRVTPPIEAARAAVREARAAGADTVIVLSPLGEEMSERLAREVEGMDLVVNAGRRTTSGSHFRAGGTLVVQFDFQGRSLCRTRLIKPKGAARLPVASSPQAAEPSSRRGGQAPKFTRQGGSVRAEPIDPVVLGPKVPDDPAVAGIVKEGLEEIPRAARRRVLTIELFKMALCPYSPKVERTLAEILRAIPDRVSLRVTHIVRVDAKGEIDSLHGRPEVEEARRQAAIFEFYPGRYWDYAARLAKDPADTDWERRCRELGIGVARVKGAVATGESDDTLRRSAARAERLRVSASPTLYLGGRRYEGGTGRLEVLRAVCSMLAGRGGIEGVGVCKGVPECFSDADCRKPGYVGECVKPGTKQAKCAYYRAVKVEAVVVEDGRAVHSPVGRILDSLRVFLPGLEERRVDCNSPEGRAFVDRYGIDRLPAYVIDKAALTERKIDPIKEALVPTEDKLVLAPRLAGSHQDITRRRTPGRVDLFLAPHSTAAAEALAEVLGMAARGEASHVYLRSVVRRDAKGKLAAPGGLAEIEAMLREIAVSRLQADKLERYLRARLQDVGSSYWRDPLLKIGLDPKEVRTAAESDWARALLDADAQELAELGAGGPVVLLVANQEVVPVNSRAELRHALEAVPPAQKPGPLAAFDRGLRAVPLLVRALDAVPEAARERIARGLKALTGEDFGTDVERWKAYARRRAGAP